MELSIEVASMEDFEYYYKLKSEKTAIYWGGWQNKPDKEILKKHFNKFLQGGVYENKLYVIKDNKVIGFINEIPHESDELIKNKVNISISIGIFEKERNKNYGQRALELFVKMKKNVEAYIREDNIASQRSFGKAGFIKTHDKKRVNINNLNKSIWMEKWIIKK